MSHWFWDMPVLTVFDCILENLSRNSFLNILALTAVATGAAYLLFLPEIAFQMGVRRGYGTG
jgi:membrane protein implicated in regulation of membrane protease activity